jgi:hypothetical protein
MTFANEGPTRPLEAPKPAFRFGRVALFAALAFVVGVARYGSEIDVPFDDSLASINGANYTAAIERSFRLCGYEKLRGMPYLYASPTENPAAFGFPYLNHPPLFRGFVHVATNLFGYSETGLRLPPILLSALAGAILLVAAARRFGLDAAVASTALYFAFPMSWRYGWMANYEAPLVFVGVATLAWHAAFRRRSIALYLPTYVFFLVATQIDWAGHFLAPAIWTYEAFRPKEDRRGTRVFLFAPLAVLAFAATVGHVAYGLEVDFTQALSNVYSTAVAAAGATGLAAPAWSTGEWLSRMGRDWIRGFTEPGCVLALFGLIEFLRRRARGASEASAFAFALLVPAVLNVLAFRRAAYIHDYWWFAALPFVGLSAAAIYERLRRVPLIAPLLFAALVAYAGYRTVELRGPERSRAFAGPKAVAADINRFVRPTDALMTQADLGQVGFYVDAWVTRPMTPPFGPDVVVPAAAALLSEGKLAVDRFVVLLPTIILEAGAAGPRAQNALIEALSPLGETTRYTNAELAAVAPTLARFIGGADLAVVVVEKR